MGLDTFAGTFEHFEARQPTLQAPSAWYKIVRLERISGSYCSTSTHTSGLRDSRACCQLSTASVRVHAINDGPVHKDRETGRSEDDVAGGDVRREAVLAGTDQHQLKRFRASTHVLQKLSMAFGKT